MTLSIDPNLAIAPLPQFPLWQPATWEEYEAWRDDDNIPHLQVCFDEGYLFVHDVSNEGINHAKFNDLFTLIIGAWFMAHPEQMAESLGGCVLEKPKHKGASPDLAVYLGDDAPRWIGNEPRRINLEQWRVPDLVGEIADTTLASDLDQKKRLYASLGIPEYWVIDVLGNRVFAFRSQADGQYEQIYESVTLAGLPIALLEQTMQRLSTGTNISAAAWFAQQIATLPTHS